MDAFLLVGTLLMAWSSAAPLAPSLPPDAPGHGLLAQLNALRTTGTTCPEGARPAVPALTWNDALARAAGQQASYLVTAGQVTHSGPDGSDPRDRASAAGVRATSVAEIVYLGQRPDPARALDWWQHSALHCRVMTDARYVQAGASVVTGPHGPAVVVVLSGPE